MLARTCAFDAMDLRRAATAASNASPFILPPSPSSPPPHSSSRAASSHSPPPKKRVVFCPTTTVFLFDRRLDGSKIPSDAAAPLGLGALRATVVWPLLTEEPVCPYTRRRPYACPVPPADRLSMLKEAKTTDDTLDQTMLENLRLLQELSDSRMDLMMERSGKRPAAADHYSDDLSPETAPYDDRSSGLDGEHDEVEDEDGTIWEQQRPAKRACIAAPGCSSAQRSADYPRAHLTVTVPSIIPAS